jgi:hypothetical protein
MYQNYIYSDVERTFNSGNAAQNLLLSHILPKNRISKRRKTIILFSFRVGVKPDLYFWGGGGEWLVVGV